MEVFLRNHSAEAVGTFNHEHTADAPRVLAQIFADATLKQVEQQISQTLEAIYNFLPESGPQFKQEAKDLAGRILKARKEGTPNRYIAKAVFASLPIRV